MNHAQVSRFVRHGHDLEGDAVGIVAEEHQAALFVRAIRSWLVEDQSAVPNDEADLFILDAMFPCRLTDLDG